jgi:hypothetical protein
VSDRVHNSLLTLIGLVTGIYALTLLGGTFSGDLAGFAKLSSFLVAVFVGAVAVGFIKRQGWAFLVFSVGLLGAWLYEMVVAIVAFTGDKPVGGHLFCFVLITVLIGYLGRWEMERRFRPHLDH